MDYASGLTNAAYSRRAIIARMPPPTHIMNA